MDVDGNSIIFGDFSYPGEPNGRIIVFSSNGILTWLRQRQLEDLVNFDRIGVDATFKVLVNMNKIYYHIFNY